MLQLHVGFSLACKMFVTCALLNIIPDSDLPCKVISHQILNFVIPINNLIPAMKYRTLRIVYLIIHSETLYEILEKNLLFGCYNNHV